MACVSFRLRQTNRNTGKLPSIWTSPTGLRFSHGNSVLTACPRRKEIKHKEVIAEDSCPFYRDASKDIHNALFACPEFSFWKGAMSLRQWNHKWCWENFLDCMGAMWWKLITCQFVLGGENKRLYWNTRLTQANTSIMNKLESFYWKS